MNCYKCGKINDDDSIFCKHCGNSLKDPDAAATNLHYTIFDNPSQKAKLNTELGYLIIALIILINISIWFFWGVIGVSNGNIALFKASRILSVLFVITEFTVMILFTKRHGYRVAIGIIGTIVTIYNLFFLIDSL